MPEAGTLYAAMAHAPSDSPTVVHREARDRALAGAGQILENWLRNSNTECALCRRRKVCGWRQSHSGCRPSQSRKPGNPELPRKRKPCSTRPSRPLELARRRRSRCSTRARAASGTVNVATRGTSFAEAAGFEWDRALVIEDARQDYGKRRFQALGRIGERGHMLVSTRHTGRAHVIGPRRASNARSEVMKRKRDPEQADRENPAWTNETFSRARRAYEVLPEVFGAATAAKMRKPRGRPKSGKVRTSVSLRVPPETVARWRAAGPGWPTRTAGGADQGDLASGPARQRSVGPFRPQAILRLHEIAAR
jgi:uncharacterized protein